jgi:hypothetical protein
MADAIDAAGTDDVFDARLEDPRERDKAQGHEQREQHYRKHVECLLEPSMCVTFARQTGSSPSLSASTRGT